jgi:hypothetical protein
MAAGRIGHGAGDPVGGRDQFDDPACVASDAFDPDAVADGGKDRVGAADSGSRVPLFCGRAAEVWTGESAPQGLSADDDGTGGWE